MFVNTISGGKNEELRDKFLLLKEKRRNVMDNESNGWGNFINMLEEEKEIQEYLLR